MKRKDYKEMVWQKTRQIKTPLSKKKQNTINPMGVYPMGVYPSMLQEKREGERKIVCEYDKEVIKQVKKLTKELRFSMLKGNKVFSFRAPERIMLMLKELKEIIGGSLANVIRMAIVHLYADVKKGVDLWQ